MSEKELIKKIQEIANNVLYFDDNSDYSAALWCILKLTGSKTEYPEDLEYIEIDNG